MYAIRSYYVFKDSDGIVKGFYTDALKALGDKENVITSYSIHYTKLYDTSVLPVGVIRIDGEFLKGDIITIKNSGGNKLGVA